MRPKLSLNKKSYPALSIRQPWAGYVVSGLKTIEIRSWATQIRGTILIHASKIRDDRPEATRWMKPVVAELCSFQGGIIGAVDLLDCHAYTTLPNFERDCGSHLNDPSWFLPQGLFGFRLANPMRLPFLPCSGQTRFFNVTEIEMPPRILPPEMPL